MEEGLWVCLVCIFDNLLDSLICDICDILCEDFSEKVSDLLIFLKEKGVVLYYFICFYFKFVYLVFSVFYG